MNIESHILPFDSCFANLSASLPWDAWVHEIMLHGALKPFDVYRILL